MLSVFAAPDRVSSPVPLSDPANVILPVTVGLFPNGKLQPLLIVFVIVPVCANVTKLNTALLQVKVAVVAPSNVTVPPLALNVDPLLSVNVLANVAVPLGAVKTAPELSVKVSLKSTVV